MVPLVLENADEYRELGIIPERIEPGHPEQNGRHEQMHRTLKAEATRPPAADAGGQQGACGPLPARVQRRAAARSARAGDAGLALPRYPRASAARPRHLRRPYGAAPAVTKDETLE
jgi:hypothetical protein